MMTKEEIPLSVAMLGLIICVWLRKFKIGLFTMLVGFLWSFAMVMLVIPAFNPNHTYSFFTWFQTVNSDAVNTQLLRVPVIIFTNYFSNPDDMVYYFSLLKGYAFLPIIGFPWLILSLPDLVINLVSDHAQMRSILFQYSSGITPGLTIATIFAFYYLKLLLNRLFLIKKYFHPAIYVIALLVLAVSLWVSYRNGPIPINPACACAMYQVNNDDKNFAKLLAGIPRNIP